MKKARSGINRRFASVRRKMEGPRGKARFARRIGELHSNVSRWEKERTIPARVIAKVAGEYGVSPAWLLTGKGEMVPAAESEHLRNAEIRVIAVSKTSGAGRTRARTYVPEQDEMGDFFVLPLLRDAAAAGPGRQIRDDDVEGPAIIHRNWCPNPELTDYVRVSGDSMGPTIPHGSIVTIDKSQSDPRQLVGRVVAVYIAQTEDVTIKRLRRDDLSPDRYIAVPDNMTTENPPHILDADDRIIGRVTSVHAEVQ